MTINPFILHGEEVTPVRKLLYLKAFAGGGALSEYELTGNPVAFNTNVQKPLSGFTIPFYPVQAGSGDPSPDNIRPITGWTGLTANRSGKNMYSYDGDRITDETTSSGTTRSVYHTGIFGDGGKITLSAERIDSSVGTSQNINCGVFENGKATVKDCFIKEADTSASVTLTPATGQEVVFIYTSANASNMKANLQKFRIQIEVGETASPYAEYTGQSYPVTFPKTIYGGTLDATTGVLTVDKGFAVFNGSEYWIEYSSFDGYYVAIPQMKKGSRQDGICNMLSDSKTSASGQTNVMWLGVNSNRLYVVGVYDSMGSNLSDFEQYLSSHNLEIVYPLATPIEIQLDPITVQTLIGGNTIWTDTNGSNTIKYKKKG